MNQFDIITGTFRPKNLDTLKPSAVSFIGQTGHWHATGVIEDGQYAGQWMLEPYEWSVPPPFTWVPECDVAIH
jgi:hypothetical protein